MYTIGIITYNANGKLHAIKAIKAYLNIGLKEAKDWVDSLPKTLEYQTKEDIVFYDEHFNNVIIGTESNPYHSNHNIQEPDEATAIALIWLSAQPDFIRDNVKLIGDWEHRSNCIVAVC